MSWFNIHYNAKYDLNNIPKTSNYDELCYILSHGLVEGLYKNLPGKICGDKAKLLLIEWGFGEPQYEIY